MRAVLVALMLVVAACGDAGDLLPTVTRAPEAPPATGPVEEWCDVLAGVDPALPLFSGASINTADVEGTAQGVATAYERLAEAPPGPVAGDMVEVRDGYASFRDDLAVVGWEYEKLFAAIGQRPWQQREFITAGERVAAFAADECGVEVAPVVPAPAEVDPIARGFLVDAFVDTGLSETQAGCLADSLGPDLGAGAAQPMAFEDAMADCGITFENFIPDE